MKLLKRALRLVLIITLVTSTMPSFTAKAAPQLPQVKNVRWDEGVLRWSAIEEADYYQVEFYLDNKHYHSTQTVGTETEYRLAKPLSVDELRKHGDFVGMVAAKSKNTNYTDGLLSNVSNVLKLTEEDVQKATDVFDAIDALPSVLEISFAHVEDIKAVKTDFDNLSTLQQSLVDNDQKLKNITSKTPDQIKSVDWKGQTLTWRRPSSMSYKETGYLVELYKDSGTTPVESITIPVKAIDKLDYNYNFMPLMTKQGAGAYYCTVTSLGYPGAYDNALPSAPSKVVQVGEKGLPALKPVYSELYSDTILGIYWSTDLPSRNVLVELFYEDEAKPFDTLITKEGKASLLDKFRLNNYRYGEYTVKLTVLGDGKTTANSLPVSLPVPYKPTVEDVTAANAISQAITARPSVSVASIHPYAIIYINYWNMSAIQRSLVRGYDQLEKDFNAALKLRDAVHALEDRFMALPSSKKINYTHKKLIEGLQKTLVSLTDDQYYSISPEAYRRYWDVIVKYNSFIDDYEEPKISKIKNLKHYNKDMKIKFSDNVGILKATLSKKGKTKYGAIKEIKNGTVVKAPGTYRLTVIDLNNNRTILRFIIDKKKPKKPKVAKVTTKSKKVTGRAKEMGNRLNVYVYRGKKRIAKGKTQYDGEFKLKIPKQKKNTVLSVYVVDRAGNKGKATKIKVKSR